MEKAKKLKHSILKGKLLSQKTLVGMVLKIQRKIEMAVARRRLIALRHMMMLLVDANVSLEAVVVALNVDLADHATVVHARPAATILSATAIEFLVSVLLLTSEGD